MLQCWARLRTEEFNQRARASWGGGGGGATEGGPYSAEQQRAQIRSRELQNDYLPELPVSSLMSLQVRALMSGQWCICMASRKSAMSGQWCIELHGPAVTASETVVH